MVMFNEDMEVMPRSAIGDEKPKMNMQKTERPSF